VSAGQARATVVLGERPDPVERNAATLLVDEIRERSGATLGIVSAGDPLPGGALILLGTPPSNSLILASGVRPLDDPDGEAIVIDTVEIGGQPAVVAAGAGPRGALYAAVEILEQARLVDGDLDVPELHITHRPSFRVRGWEQHGPAVFDTGRPMLAEQYRRNLHFVARRRGNTACLGQAWPDNSSVLVGYRHFPALYDPAAEPALEARRTIARDLVGAGKGLGIDVFLTVAELRYPDLLAEVHPEIKATPPRDGDGGFSPDRSWFRQPPMRLCTSHPTTWQWFRAKTRELIEVVPDAAGLELWVSWADTDVFYCACKRCLARPPSEHLAELVQQALAGMDQAAPGAGKRLILRTYLGGWRQVLEERFFGPLAGRLDPRVSIVNKAQEGDMCYGNALTRLAGCFEPRNTEGVEFCLGGEYRAGLGWGTLAPISQYVQDRIEIYAERGVTGVLQRHLDWANRFTRPEFEAFYALAWDLRASPEAIWQRWALGHFGAEVGPRVLELLGDATRVMEGALYVRGVALTSHSLFGENLQRARHLMVDRSAKSVDGGLERVAPTAENVRRIDAEKDAAVALSSRILDRLERLRQELPEEDYEALFLSFNMQHELALAYRALAAVLWRFLRWEATLSEVEREFQRQDLGPAIESLRAVVRRLRERIPLFWGPHLFAALGTDPVTASQDHFRGEFPFHYLDTIADDVEREIGVAQGSYWGYYPRPVEY